MAFWQKNTIKHDDTAIPSECQHIWKDFPWYLTYNYSVPTYEYWIKEPYVCVCCGERKDAILQHEIISFRSDAQVKQFQESLYEKYKELRPLAEVEDMVRDTQLVDRNKLYWYEWLHNSQKSKDSITLPPPRTQLK